MPSAYHLPPGYNLAQAILWAPRFLRDPIRTISRNTRKFGGTYSARLPQRRRVIVTEDPGFVQYILKDNHTNYYKSELSADRAAFFFGRGLLFSNGDHWLQQRRLIQPGFHREKIRSLYDILVRTTDVFLTSLPRDATVDIYPLAHRLSFELLIHSLFDLEIQNEKKEELRHTFTDVQGLLMREVNQPFQRALYPLTGKDRRMSDRMQRIRYVIESIIKDRRDSGGDHHDLLDMLLAARYEDTGEPMADGQLIDEIMILFFAGHETTANALSWLCYLLAPRRDIQDRIGNLTGDIYESPRDEYLAAVINEGMRVFPPAWMTERVALADDGYGAFTYPKGTIIIPYFYGVHRNPAFWDRPDAFEPERFLGEKKNKAFFPFGGGPRLCIGNGFAMAEMAIFLRLFFEKNRLEPTGRTPRLQPLITLRPSEVIVKLYAR